MTARERQGPLDGLRVIDMSGMISGAFATTMLGDFGADVVMIEHPETGDPIREWPQKTEDGVSLSWKSLGRNKRCVTLDLGSERGRDIALALIADADAVYENFRPGTMERWGLGPDDVHEVNEEAIMVRLSGYGQTGPKSQKPGFGTIAEGVSGWAHANGFPDREPLLPPVSLADIQAAQFALQATLMAIFERDLGRGGSGEGQVIDVSLTEPLWRIFFGEVEAYDRMGHVRERTGNQHPNTAPRNIYETADGYLTMSASNQKIFERVAETIDKEWLIDDERFADNATRVANSEPLNAEIEEWTRERTTDEAIETLEANDAIVGPVYDMHDIFEDEQFDARDDIIEVDDPDVGAIKTFGLVPKFSRTPGEVEFLGPRHGEHNREVYYGELGLSEAELAELQDEGII
ncbi:CaiB/BaiF CoA transferase family protein [Halococcus saccharolyticus]|uniref:L-carnitine dehydratase/bile acid-inducible protein F n=1 Tax=Halococcus saccharolyticus DSM 5350 TaxID=1227455 RepID=M0MMZ3_9EURY|nr:CoA transferase [Halococcus saccharolyticus]EMA47047.1 L-carnitine dehydratase/bile acid-inducible protein F [Halococcus saccharolyticus DSM 5350]